MQSKESDESRGGLGREALTSNPLPRFYFFALLFTSHRSPVSERLEQAKITLLIQRFVSSEDEYWNMRVKHQVEVFFSSFQKDV